MASQPMTKSYCFSEYDPLQQVIVCSPQHMTIRDVINDTQEHFLDEGINVGRAIQQHTAFINTLRQYGITVHLLPYYKKFPEQVFTRDIGFTIGPTIFVAEMASKVRQGEENILKEWLEDEAISYYNLIGERIEGGDVIVDKETIYIGLSQRTTRRAVEHLQTLLTQFKVIAIPFKARYLHLDCVFNVISPDVALVFPEALTQENMALFASKYELIEVTKEEQFTLGTNVLAIGNNRILSLPVNKQVNKALRARGFEVIEINLSEIIKSGGSFRCCTLPIIRGSDNP
ncbi:hypothetical protein GCM10011391_09790 [Pullulanibacillus camelliae]|uniref:N-dimethylarginine dimethylaminohydrolase n=1 Tax=Pullulanibacillus camelliae TaxID=1707096 RepID=A0A8J2YFM4_9BACL|nr:dimethylarginine dimethylaminohydrolase family protein [Pullulanibacillus camelliae]GGE33181.1 hypothetical protein GCM10011391_09790 [Pullulanibacillus camelliae]